MDMKGLNNYAISVHMDARPQTKKVPLVFSAWLVLDQATEENNCFRECQLLLDRHGAMKPRCSNHKFIINDWMWVFNSVPMTQPWLIALQL